MNIRNIGVILYIFFIHYLCGQTVVWSYTYNSGFPGSNNDIGAGVFETEDNEFLVIANTEYAVYDSGGHYLRAEAPFLIIKTDEYGNMIDRNFYCDPHMYGWIGIGSNNNIFEFGEDTIIAVAKENVSIGTRTRNKIYILGLNLDGDSLFCSILDTSMNLLWPTTAPTNDGNLITWAKYDYEPEEGDSFQLFKHTITGDTLWHRKYSHHRGPFYIFPTQDGGYLLNTRPSVMKVDSVGDSLWAMTLPHYATPTSIIETAPNEFLCLAVSGYCYIAVYKLLGDGEIDWWRQWMFDYSDTSYLYAYSLIPTFDGNYVFCGQTGSYMGTGHQADAFLVKIDSLANVIWQERYDLYGRPDIFHSVIQASDSSFVCTGYTSLCTDPDSVECESLEVCLVKISNDGDIIWENSIPVPKHISLSAYPNPFNSAVTISFDCGSESAKRLSTIEIFDLNGRMVDEISVGEGLVPCRTSGDHKGLPYEYIWKPSESLGSGVYLVRAKYGGSVRTARVVYLK